jgi:hypothetical protein
VLQHLANFGAAVWCCEVLRDYAEFGAVTVLQHIVPQHHTTAPDLLLR